MPGPYTPTVAAEISHERASARMEHSPHTFDATLGLQDLGLAALANALTRARFGLARLKAPHRLHEIRGRAPNSCLSPSPSSPRRRCLGPVLASLPGRGTHSWRT
jgi:hypothetical protein